MELEREKRTLYAKNCKSVCLRNCKVVICCTGIHSWVMKGFAVPLRHLENKTRRKVNTGSNTQQVLMNILACKRREKNA